MLLWIFFKRFYPAFVGFLFVGLLEKPLSSGSPITSPVLDAHLVPNSPLFPPSCPGTPPAQDDSWRQTALRGAASNIKSLQTGVFNSYCVPRVAMS